MHSLRRHINAVSAGGLCKPKGEKEAGAAYYAAYFPHRSYKIPYRAGISILVTVEMKDYSTLV